MARRHPDDPGPLRPLPIGTPHGPPRMGRHPARRGHRAARRGLSRLLLQGPAPVPALGLGRRTVTPRPQGPAGLGPLEPVLALRRAATLLAPHGSRARRLGGRRALSLPGARRDLAARTHQLHRALRAYPEAPRRRPLRAHPAAPLVGGQPQREPGRLHQPAAPCRPSREPGPPLPAPADLRGGRSAATALRLFGDDRPRPRPAALAPGDEPPGAPPSTPRSPTGVPTTGTRRRCPTEARLAALKTRNLPLFSRTKSATASRG